MYMKMFTFALEFFVVGAVLECVCMLIGYVVNTLIELMTK